jgi:tetratricopeptide (TPR) repeat protein
LYVAFLHAFRAALRAVETRECEQARADLLEAERLVDRTYWAPYVHVAVARIQTTALRDICPALYEGPTSIERVRAELTHSPDNDQAQRALGYLLFHEGEFAEALEILQRFDEEHEFDEAGDLFYLAMTNWKLGRKTEARRCYDRAVVRLGATFPNDQEWRRLQRETASLLGVDQEEKRR